VQLLESVAIVSQGEEGGLHPDDAGTAGSAAPVPSPPFCKMHGPGDLCGASPVWRFELGRLEGR
jgi:hypothetical protein